MRIKEYSNLQIGDKVIHLKYGVCTVSDSIDVEQPKRSLKGLSPVTCEGRNKLTNEFGQGTKMIYESELKKLRCFV
jgi:hypothetical protein